MAELNNSTNQDTTKDYYLWNVLQHSTSLLSRIRELELAQSGITVEQSSILHAILMCGGSATIDEIAAIVVRQHNSVSTLINRMCEAGLVKKEKRFKEKKFVIEITEKARDIVVKTPRRSIEKIFSDLSSNEKEDLAACMGKLINSGHDVLGHNFNLPFLSKAMITEDDLISIDKLKNFKHESNIVELRPWKSRHATITAPMITALGAKDIPESNLGIGFAYVTKPETFIDETHQHPFDQWLFFIGADGNNLSDFDADIEIYLDGKKEIINFSGYVFIPKGMNHCPLVIKRVGKPLIFMDARTTEKASVRSDLY
jgi:DNA-binding MarR family transcriptional regulator